MKCICCSRYFRQSAWNTSNYCEDCIDNEEKSDYNYIDLLDKVEIDTLLNPSGKTPARFYD